MSAVDILEPVLSGGIRNTNFFNGRLLTAEDLTDFQSANAQQHQQLAHALGEGVVYGLEVNLAPSSTPAQAVLRISQGLAFNRKGQAVALPSDTDLALVPPPDPLAADAGLFQVCQPPTATVLTNPGLYVLTISPASGFSSESAPKTNVFNEGVASTCGSRWIVEGAKFSTVQLDLGTNPDPSTLAGQAEQIAASLTLLLEQLSVASGATADSLRAQIAPLMSKLRNCAAHLCFGTEQLKGFAANPFGRSNGSSLFAEYGALDHLRDLGNLSDCDVPLAILYWTTTGLQFIDMWSARRPVLSQAVSEAWAPLAGQRRAAEGLAMFLQFQCQISGLLNDLSPTALDVVRATDYFRYLPPVGLLPISDIASSSGFEYLTFFSANVYRRPEFMEGARLPTLVRDAFLYPAVDVTEKVMVWIYWIRENMQAFNTGSSTPANAYVVFASGHLPNFGCPHYDVNRWDYSTYV
jgi:hypothetical protein